MEGLPEGWAQLICAEHFLRDGHGRRLLRVGRPLMWEGEVVGAWHPRLAGAGWFRVGPIWIHPDHRGRGIASRAIAEVTAGRRSRAWIEEDNEGSKRAFAAAGFVRRYRSHPNTWVWEKRP